MSTHTNKQEEQGCAWEMKNVRACENLVRKKEMETGEGRQHTCVQTEEEGVSEWTQFMAGIDPTYANNTAIRASDELRCGRDRCKSQWCNPTPTRKKCTEMDWNEEQDETEEEKRRGGLGWERGVQEKQGRGQRFTKAASGKAGNESVGARIHHTLDLVLHVETHADCRRRERQSARGIISIKILRYNGNRREGDTSDEGGIPEGINRE
ncbi:hypothetical protein K438DRAFT_1766381 [Mycena galopus ATCC 62051]|nr:hypothetical protein K438DRAFT_1766381 [Mycena galopus ATCC 62051]